jgi:hypothetical protein
VFDVARQWANILTDEFANQGVMEEELGIPTCLFGGPPSPGDLMKLGESQLGFTSVFALPLFEGVAKLLPGMMFGVDELSKNKEVWAKIIADEKEKAGVAPVKDTNSRKESAASVTSTIKPAVGVMPIPSEDQTSSASLSEKGTILAASSVAVTAVALPLSQQLEAMASMSPGSPPSQPLPQPPTGVDTDKPRGVSPSKKLKKKGFADKVDMGMGRRPSSPTLASNMLSGGGFGTSTGLNGGSGENGHGNGNGTGNGNGSVLKGMTTANTTTPASTINTATHTVSNTTSHTATDSTNATSLATTETTKSTTTSPKKKKSRRSLWLGEHFSRSHEDVPPVPSQTQTHAPTTQSLNDSPNSSEEGFHGNGNGNGNGHASAVREGEEAQGHSMPGWKKLLFRRKNKKDSKGSTGSVQGLAVQSTHTASPDQSQASTPGEQTQIEQAQATAASI